MNFFRIILLISVLFALSGCFDCGCNLIDTNIYSDSQSDQEDLILFADGCASTSGAINIDGVPNGSCDATGQYVNRGRWVKVPNIVPEFNSVVNITTEGSLYFCSTGYDNQNPTPIMTINPSASVKYTFDDSSNLPVVGGEEVAIVMADGDSTGFTVPLGSSAVIADCGSFSSPYQSLINGQCRAYNGFALTIYVGATKIVTLDQLDNSSDPYQYYSSASRTFNLYNMVPSNELSSFYTQAQAKYNRDISGQGRGKFAFIVPDGLKGNLGFILANGQAINGSGHYKVQVNSTPTACYVENAEASYTPGNRGAIELVMSSINPNDYDNAVSAMNTAIGNWATSSYYDSIIAYVNSFAGLTTSGNVAPLSSLLVDSAESSLTVQGMDPILITTSNFILDTINNYGGSIWLKVRDDYYSDNVGHYNVTINYTYAGDTSAMVSKFLDKLITPIVNSFWGLAHSIYDNFGTGHFLNIVRMSLLIYIMVYGAQFALGLTKISSYDLLFRIIKIGVVVELFHVAESWDFFNAYFFQFFQSGMNTLISYVTGDYTTNKTGIFGFVDNIFAVFFAKQTWVKLTALIPYLVGIFYMMAIVQIMALYILILSRAIVSYLLVTIGTALLISLAPIFFILLLFKKTKSYFDNWISRLVDYALQPVLMFAALSILTSFFLLFWNSMMDFDVCWGSVLDFKFYLGPFSAGKYDTISLGCLTFYNIKGGLDGNALVMFVNIAVLGVFTLAINNLMSHIPEITGAITGVSSASMISHLANKTVQQGIDGAEQGVGTLQEGAKKVGNFFSNVSRKFNKRKGGGGDNNLQTGDLDSMPGGQNQGVTNSQPNSGGRENENLQNSGRSQQRSALPSVSGINSSSSSQPSSEENQDRNG